MADTRKKDEYRMLNSVSSMEVLYKCLMYHERSHIKILYALFVVLLMRL